MFDHVDDDALPKAPNGSDSHSTPFQPLAFDPKPYLHHLDGSDLTETQKVELLETLWQIMVHFVDLGLGISPIQQAMDKFPKKETGLASGFSDVVKSKNNRKINRKRKLRPARELGVRG